MCVFAKFKNIFGAPGTGVHAYRVGNIAVVDLGLTLLFAWVWAIVFRHSLWKTTAVLLLLGVVAHALFGVNTAGNKWLYSLVRPRKPPA